VSGDLRYGHGAAEISFAPSRRTTVVVHGSFDDYGSPGQLLAVYKRLVVATTRKMWPAVLGYAPATRESSTNLATFTPRDPTCVGVNGQDLCFRIPVRDLVTAHSSGQLDVYVGLADRRVARIDVISATAATIQATLYAIPGVYAARAWAANVPNQRALWRTVAYDAHGRVIGSALLTN
jgi:hypothetical protein